MLKMGDGGDFGGLGVVVWVIGSWGKKEREGGRTPADMLPSSPSSPLSLPRYPHLCLILPSIDWLAFTLLFSLTTSFFLPLPFIPSPFLPFLLPFRSRPFPAVSLSSFAESKTSWI